jgi:hypothetical protein
MSERDGEHLPDARPRLLMAPWGQPVERDRVGLQAVRMGGGECRASLARRAEGVEDSAVERNEGAEADVDGVRGSVRVEGRCM